MSLYKNQRQYDLLADAELELMKSMHDWMNAGGSIDDVMHAIKAMIDVRVEVALENRGE